MSRLLSIGSYAFAIILWTVMLKAMWGPKDAPPHGVMPTCYQVIVSEFGDPRLYQTRVCSDEDLARIYGQQALREQAWVTEHECDSQDADEPDVERMKAWRR